MINGYNNLNVTFLQHIIGIFLLQDLYNFSYFSPEKLVYNILKSYKQFSKIKKKLFKLLCSCIVVFKCNSSLNGSQLCDVKLNSMINHRKYDPEQLQGYFYCTFVYLFIIFLCYIGISIIFLFVIWQIQFATNQNHILLVTIITLLLTAVNYF